MENNTSNYAKWIPEAGGYVHNGVVVSKNPLYDNTGRQQIEVDIANLTTPKPSGTQENQANSGVDVNAGITQAGSLGTLNTNTPNPGLGTINTPATNSNVAGQTVLSPIDQINKDYEYMVATNNIKGQIDKLTQLSQMTGVDYSQTINDLWNQRSQKIKNEDNAYTEAIAQARQAGDEQLAQELTIKQQLYRDNVGYYDQLGRDLQNGQDSLYVDYQTTYMQGINDITNGILSQLNNLINFQYSPELDMNLQVAQGYAVGAVKEQMNHTGMYYSSMTQSAIARAVAELVPVYEEMAKDEIRENISLLQNVGNYLMNLEEMQLGIWEAQLNMKIKANAEKRAQINQAIDNANARGYYTNEEAVLLGVPAGTESHEARIRAEDKQDEIEKEQRQLQNQMTLAKYNKELQLQLTQAEYALKNYYSSTPTENTVDVVEYKYDDEGNKIAEYKYKTSSSQLSNNNGITNGSIMGEYSEAVKSAISKLQDSEGNYDYEKIKSYISNNEFKNMSDEDKNDLAIDVQANYYKNRIEELSKNFGDDRDKTAEAIRNIISEVEEYADLVKEANINNDMARIVVNDLYNDVFSKINDAEKFNFVVGGTREGEASKALAEIGIISSMERKENNEILASLAKDYEQLKEQLTNIYRGNSTGASSNTSVDNMLTENKGGSTSDKKIYVTLNPPDSSGYSVEEFAKRLGFKYDKDKGKAFYYEGNYPDLPEVYKNNRNYVK